eukprot:CAMPEP_0201566926 /NCGR_PEP_ID=MMETSP0190_2-20130828/7086_1 /ASSEMBLY_ACC=CAM_ASM_000263 /TAXON_ID=37353 /ORGANISM="Rosalina sp." /LENGTH=114 /DNA_ID=CAMNT_0047986285 /DNA_START=30 /DNA_END=375 /DNA_ORIENTATION=+
MAANTTPNMDTKFCISCGWQLPGIAKFCSHCGQSQDAQEEISAPPAHYPKGRLAYVAKSSGQSQDAQKEISAPPAYNPSARPADDANARSAYAPKGRLAYVAKAVVKEVITIKI